MGNDFGLTESLFPHVGSGLFVFATDNLRFAPYDRGLTLCLKAYKVGPPTSRPGGPVFELAGGAAVIGQLKGEER
jgi:hypothetical protein